MFRKRRRGHGLTIGNLLGLICCIIGCVILIYIIPYKLWIFLFGCCFIVVGLFVFRL